MTARQQTVDFTWKWIWRSSVWDVNLKLIFQKQFKRTINLLDWGPTVFLSSTRFHGWCLRVCFTHSVSVSGIIFFFFFGFMFSQNQSEKMSCELDTRSFSVWVWPLFVFLCVFRVRGRTGLLQTGRQWDHGMPRYWLHKTRWNIQPWTLQGSYQQDSGRPYRRRQGVQPGGCVTNWKQWGQMWER